jgi:hypothetical protein
MAVRKKRSISLPPDLDTEIADAAAQAGMTYSAWLAAIAAAVSRRLEIDHP